MWIPVWNRAAAQMLLRGMKMTIIIIIYIKTYKSLLWWWDSIYIFFAIIFLFYSFHLVHCIYLCTNFMTFANFMFPSCVKYSFAFHIIHVIIVCWNIICLIKYDFVGAYWCVGSSAWHAYWIKSDELYIHFVGERTC